MSMHGVNSVQIENCVLLTIANQEIDWRDVMLVEKMYVRCPADKESMTDPRCICVWTDYKSGPI